MKYQYNENSIHQSDSKLKLYAIRIFLLVSFIGFLYQGYNFFESAQSKLRRYEDKYCGKLNCYEVLQIEKQHFHSFDCLSVDPHQNKKQRKVLDSLPESITLIKIHKTTPQKCFSKFSLIGLMFRLVSKAYETLISEKSRFIYDMYLENPDQSQYRREFEYYNKKYIQNPHIPVSYVIIGVVVCISLLQYVMRKQMFQTAVERISHGQEFKIKVNQRSKLQKRHKETVRQEMIKEIEIEGGFAKPTYKDIFAYKLLIFPWTVLIWIKWNVLWIGKYWLLRKQYSQEDKVYLTMKALNIPQRQWNNLEENEKNKMIHRSLWIEENKQKFISQKRREWLERLKIENPNRYNMTVKYMRNHGIKID